jgi:hypothetical protein
MLNSANIDKDNDFNKLKDSGIKFDLSNITLLKELFTIPEDKRDYKWLQLFRSFIWNASLQASKEQIIQGPDGFQYFALFLPEPNVQFESYSLNHVAEFCVSNAIGVVVFASNPLLNPELPNPKYAFNTGLLDSLYRYKSWSGGERGEASSTLASDEIVDVGTRSVGLFSIPAGEQIAYGYPSDDAIPPYTRLAIGDFMRAWGFQSPRMGLGYVENGGLMIILNCQPHEFQSQQDIHQFTNYICWYFCDFIG